MLRDQGLGECGTEVAVRRPGHVLEVHAGDVRGSEGDRVSDGAAIVGGPVVPLAGRALGLADPVPVPVEDRGARAQDVSVFVEGHHEGALCVGGVHLDGTSVAVTSA